VQLVQYQYNSVIKQFKNNAVNFKSSVVKFKNSAIQFKNSAFQFRSNAICKTFQFIIDRLSSYYSAIQFSTIQFVRKKTLQFV